MRAARGGPETGHEIAALLALLEEGVVLEEQAARLEVGLAGAGLDRHQLVVDDVEHHPVDVGQLLTVGVDPVEVGVALEDEALGRRWRGQLPGLERRQLRVLELVHVVVAAVELRPVARLGLLDHRGELVGVGVALVELLEVVRRHVDEQRRRLRQRRQEERVGLRPAVAHRELVGELDIGQLAVDEEVRRGAGRAQRLVVGDVLPPVAEVLAGERLAVGPRWPLRRWSVKLRPSSMSTSFRMSGTSSSSRS